MQSKGVIIDVSKYQRNIDWPVTAKAIDFAIIRVQDNTILDSKLVRNIAGVKANDVPYALYAYFRAGNERDAATEADLYYDRALAAGADDPILWYVDVEKKTASWKQQRAAVSAYAARLRKRGAKRVGLYTFQAMYPRLKALAAEFDDVWLARYGDKKTNLSGLPGKWPGYSCGLHQYTSCARCDGINTRVDMNRLTGLKPLSWYTGRTYDSDPDEHGQVKVSGLTVHVRSGPGKAWNSLGIVRKGAVLPRTGEDYDGWFGVEYKGQKAHISTRYAKEVQ